MKKPLLFGIILTVCVVIVTFVFAQFYPEGMISYWKFDEGSGTTALDSVDANDGTIYGPTWTPGMVGDALSFDGVYGYVDCGNDASLSGMAKLTIEAWVKPTIINRWNHIVDKTGSHGQISGYKFSITNGNKFRFRIRFMDDSMTALYSNTMAQVNLWYHYVATYDQEQMRIYINGNLDNSISEIKAIKHSSSSLVIGYNWEPSHTFSGTIDEVAIYNRALSAEEIQRHYQDGLHGLGYDVECVIPPSGLVSWWPGDGDANDIADGNDGTLEQGGTYATGRVGQAFSFDGVDGYVNLAATQIIGDDTSFTIDAWIKVNSFATYNKQLPIYGEYYSGTNDTKNYLAVGNTQSGLGQRVFFDQFVPTGGYLKSNIQLTPNRWYHVAYTQDEITRCLYIDGTLDISDPFIETYTGPMPDGTRIGRRGGIADNMRFDGLIDELEIFDRALSAEEIQAIYSAGSAGKCQVIEVDIDIKPGSDPNSINLGSRGNVPVAIFSTADFDATTVDPLTVTLAGAEVKLKGKGTPMSSAKDVDGDGLLDLIVHVDTTALALTGTETVAILRGVTFDGIKIRGEDTVRIVSE